ncbi:MAG: LysM peptidoglycan-binding domain-containing protein [Flavobacteriales bacterium]|nr:LysM peptidoglycan-binding domain-containing protein [Flavobacteriales bacterium]
MEKIVKYISLLILFSVLLVSLNKYYGYEIDTSSLVIVNKDCNCKNRKLNTLNDSNLAKIISFNSEICQLLCKKKLNHPYIDTLIRKNNLPPEFSFLPIVNSQLNSHHNNGLGSLGIWELNYIYALHNGLKMNQYVDERKDPIRSSFAAVNQLKFLFDKYQDPNWTLLAFWSSPAHVNNIQKTVDSRVWEECTANIEQEYLDKLSLLHDIYRLDTLGLVELKKTQSVESVFDTIVLNQKISFNAIYDLTTVDLNTINQNNPFLLKPYIPSNHPILINREEKEIIKKGLELIINYEDTLQKTKVKIEYSKKTHTVEEGDYLGKIAIDKKVSVSDIMKWNKLPNTTIYVGQKLVVYKEEANDSTLEFQKYIVVKGDQLWSIAQKFNGITVKNILEHNNINKLKEGTALKILVK